MQLVPAPAPAPAAPARLDPFLRLPEVERVVGLKRSTIYALMRKQEFPTCVRVSPRCVAWRNSQVQAWMQERIAASAHQADLVKDANQGKLA